MRHMSLRGCATAAIVAVLAASAAQAQGGAARTVTTPDGRRLVVLTPTGVARISPQIGEARRATFRTISFADKLALARAAGVAAPAPSDGTFTLTPNTPFRDGRGYLALVNADIVMGGPTNVAFETGSTSDMRAHIFLTQLEARPYLLHFSLRAGSPGHFHVLGGNAETDIQSTPGYNDVYVVVTVPPAQAGPDSVLAILSNKEPGFYWDFMGVEITPM